MAIDGLYVSGYFTDDDRHMLNTYAEVFSEKGICLSVRNLTGTIMQAAPDFMDTELIAIGYGVLQQFILNGGYDITKYFFIKLWHDITKGHKSNAPFTITIDGIPTANGPETIKCKVQGCLSAKGKDKVVDKAFTLASQVENHQYILRQKNQYYNALNGHLFSYNSVDEQLHEIDIEAELRKRTDKK